MDDVLIIQNNKKIAVVVEVTVILIKQIIITVTRFKCFKYRKVHA